MSIDNVVGGGIAGIITAILWALIVFWCNGVRNRFIQKKFTEQFFPKSFTFWGMNKQGFIVENNTGVEITIRSFELIDDVKSPTSTIQFEFDKGKSDGDIVLTTGKRVIMPPYSKGAWAAPPPEILSNGPTYWPAIKGCRIILEYKSIIGDTKRFYVSRPLNSNMQQMIALSYNERFGLPIGKEPPLMNDGTIPSDPNSQAN